MGRVASFTVGLSREMILPSPWPFKLEENLCPSSAIYYLENKTSDGQAFKTVIHVFLQSFSQNFYLAEYLKTEKMVWFWDGLSISK